MSFVPPALYAIADADSCADPLALVESLFKAGAKLVQLRAKGASAGEICALARRAIDIRASLQLSPQPLIIINDHPEICLKTGADGVHIGQDDYPPETARKILGPRAILGLSTHTIDQVLAALGSTAVPQSSGYNGPLNYIALGPIFSSPTKQGHADIVGLATLSEVAAMSPLPVVAIGGIKSSNADAVFRAGAASVALISELNAADKSGVLRSSIDEITLIAACCHTVATTLAH